MIRGQTSVRGGIEDFLCPFENFYLTCGPNESKYHKGVMAIDVRGSKPGAKEPYYAPATVKCIKTYPSSGQVMWQTTSRVRCPNGYVGIVTFMTCHDDTMDAYPGLVVPQGSQLGNMGVKGLSSGVHCHIEFSQSDDTSWYQNQYGNYMFNYEVDPENVCFMDNVNILNGYGNWKYLKDVPVEEPKPVVYENKVKNEEQQKRIEELEYQVSQLNAVQEVLEKENSELKEQLAEQPTLLFTCESDCTIKYKMLNGEKLYTK